MNRANWRGHTFRAMGCEIVFWLEATASQAEKAFVMAEALFRHNERVLSRFLPTSELSQVNGRCGQWTPVSALFWDVLNESLRLAQETKGIFDPTLLNALEWAGYDRSFELLQPSDRNFAPDKTTLTEPFCGRWAEIACDPQKQAIRLPKGVRLDFSGLAKGYTAQQAADCLSQWGACLVSAGGDVTAGEPPHGWPGWPVALQHPTHSTDVWTIWLAHATLATSGRDYRRWQKNGRSAHHLIHPATGQPADSDTLTATVWASQATTAEAWAKTAVILGTQKGATAVHNHALAGAFITLDEQFTQTPLMNHLIEAFLSSQLFFA